MLVLLGRINNVNYLVDIAEKFSKKKNKDIKDSNSWQWSSK